MRSNVHQDMSYKSSEFACAAPGAFKQQLLYQGGCLAVERLHLLHGNSAVVDTYEVIEVERPTHLATWRPALGTARGCTIICMSLPCGRCSAIQAQRSGALLYSSSAEGFVLT